MIGGIGFSQRCADGFAEARRGKTPCVIDHRPGTLRPERAIYLSPRQRLGSQIRTTPHPPCKGQVNSMWLFLTCPYRALVGCCPMFTQGVALG